MLMDTSGSEDGCKGEIYWDMDRNGVIYLEEYTKNKFRV